jgi:predicted porin
MKNRLLMAAAVGAILAATGAARAENADVTALKEQATALKKQNQALEQRLNKLEAQQKPGADNFVAQAAQAPVDLLTGEAPLTFYGITLYGMLDAGLGWQSAGSGFNGSAPQNVSELISKASKNAYFGGIQGGLGGYNYVGLKGEQALGVADLKGIFNINTNFSPLSGQLSNGPASLQQNSGLAVFNQNTNGDSSRAGQAFNNYAYVGLSSKTFGELTFGRQNSLTSSTVSGFDILSGSLAFSALGYSGSWSGGGYTEGTKWDNSLKYTYTYNNLFASGMVKFGEWGAPQTGGNGNWQVAAGVKDWNNFSATVAGGHLSGVPKLGALGVGSLLPTGTLTATLADQDVIAAGVKYKFQQWTFSGGYQFFRLTNPSTTQPSTTPTGNLAGTVNAANPWTDGNGYQVTSLTTNAYGSASNNSIFWLGTKYSYDSKLDIIGGYYHWLQNQYNTTSAKIASGAAPTAAACSAARIAVTKTTASSTTVGGLVTTTNPRASNCSGTSDAVSVVVDYHFTKRFDAYAGIMWSGVSGGLASGYQVTGVWAPSVGIRYTF